jgi:hypothetical protein
LTRFFVDCPSALAWFTLAMLSLDLMGCSSRKPSISQNETLPHDSMKAVMTVSGGFTGVGGKWELDTSSDESRQNLKAAQIEEMAQLVSEARTEGVFGKDFSKAAQGSETSAPSSTGSPAQVPADIQTYELIINGERVRWNEPALAPASATPPVIEKLKNWMLQNTQRQPYRPW